MNYLKLFVDITTNIGGFCAGIALYYVVIHFALLLIFYVFGKRKKEESGSGSGLNLDRYGRIINDKHPEWESDRKHDLDKGA